MVYRARAAGRSRDTAAWIASRGGRANRGAAKTGAGTRRQTRGCGGHRRVCGRNRARPAQTL
eukprot:5794284-Lingulodinium_polyedra.AAC.1